MKKEKRTVRYKMGETPPLNREQKARLLALKNRPVDFSDIPESTREQLENAVLMPPMTKFKSVKEWETYHQKQLNKQQKMKLVSFAAEPEVYRWLQSQGKEAQNSLNTLLKDYIHMLEQHAP